MIRVYLRALLFLLLVLCVSPLVWAECPPADLNGDNQISISELVAVVNLALNGCEPVVPRVDQNRRTDQGYLLVQDDRTGAWWMVQHNNHPIRATWWDARDTIVPDLNGLAVGGYQDWRLPLLADNGEVSSFLHHLYGDPVLVETSFDEGYYWTADYNAIGEIVLADAADGTGAIDADPSDPYYVLAVRP